MSHVDNTKELGVLSLCTGYGGIERGIEMLGINHRVILNVEIEAYAIANLVAKMEQNQMVPAPIWSNLKTIPLHCIREGIDFICGGYPCQPFSQAGLKKGEEDERHLFPYILRAIDASNPSYLFFENVSNHINIGLREVIRELEERSFKVAWGIFSASEIVGDDGKRIPHQRKRVYIYAEKLDNSNCKGSLRSSRSNTSSKEKWESEKRHTTKANCSLELPHSNRKGLQGSLFNRISAVKAEKFITRCGTEFPSRPNLKQKEWESSRVIPKTILKPNMGGKLNDGQGHDGMDTTATIMDAMNQSDRIRLLGNGVVPQCASKALYLLAKQVSENNVPF